MTELQAWLFLEKMWRNAKPQPMYNNVYAIRLTGKNYSSLHFTCLCDCICEMQWAHRISEDVFLSMDSKISAYMKKGHTFRYPDGGATFMAPQNKRGATLRANFCKRQAQLLKRGKTHGRA